MGKYEEQKGGDRTMGTLLLLDGKNKFWYSRHTRSIYLTIMQHIPQHRREELECTHLKNIKKF
jgi:hypothetical protein